ncbi:hypothetical protein CRYUN_Cryun35bG0010900 [Craigia yunnanensis]
MSFDGFPPFISAQLHYLINHFPDKIKVEQVLSGGKSYTGGLDRFALLIPYCLDRIKWDVIYYAEFPLLSPDIIFGPEDEHFQPLHMTGVEGERDLKSRTRNVLSDWNNKDPTRLLALIKELRDQYMSYQRKRVGEVDDDWLKFELSTICSREGIEMHISSGAEKPEEVKFAVPLMNMNINKMVHGCPWRHPQKIYLQVIYPVGRKYASTPSAPRLKLMSTNELRALFSVDDVKLPSWLDGMCMSEYLPHLEKSLQKQVLEAVSLIDIRRCFIEAFAPLFGRPLEADPVCFNLAIYLYI